MTLPAQAPGGRPQLGSPSDPSQRYELIAGYLALSDSQQLQVKETFTSMSAFIDDLRGQLQSKREELQTAFSAKQKQKLLAFEKMQQDRGFGSR